ncbi:hypothetical protein SAMN04488565_0678 [Leucobacter chromiiresistens]|uniref:Uncharacterized protein n=1 Tax=Leucobacter chromiiresistens TaxID=1079994 RepID=A0A1H0YA79_9MICO|nr:hypothetical protein SAMN04488565_0678 [Leucobacter chromiiresistens]
MDVTKATGGHAEATRRDATKATRRDATKAERR